MRIFILTTLFLFGTSMVVSGQITERFIKTVGKSTQTVQSIGLKVIVELKELERKRIPENP